LKILDKNVPYGYCHCGCGGKTKIIKWSDKTKGLIRGEPHRYIMGHSSRCLNWGRKIINKDGRLMIYNPKHHRATSNGYVFNHILVVEKATGIKITKIYHIHHINQDKTDDKPSNLVLCPSAKYHHLLHQRQRAKNKCGNPNWRKCQYCQQYDKPANLFIAKKSIYHNQCKAKHKRETRQSKAMRWKPRVREFTLADFGCSGEGE